MKSFPLLLIAASLFVSSIGLAQAIHCPIPCGNESFPYVFCFVTGAQGVQCSTNPNDPPPSYTPSKSKIPGCVNVIPPDTSVFDQPTDPVPEPPEPVSLPDTYDVFSGCIPDPGEVLDTGTYNAGLDEWDTDFHQVHDGHEPDVPPNRDNYDYDEEYEEALSVYDCDREDYSIFEIDIERYNTYISDSISYANGSDVHYDQVWNTGGASSDAQSDLNAWLGICGFTGDTTCCILIIPDTNILHFQGTYQASGLKKAGYPVAWTYGHPGCPDGGACPNSNYRFITYNATNSFFYQNGNDALQPIPGYKLHQSPLMGWYTGPAPDPGAANQGFYDFSFKEIIEHEIGHWLGLLHPDTIVRGDTCVNNYNYCKSSIPGYWMLMGSKQAQPNIAPRGLGSDDSCMFAKLYCPTHSDTTLGVSTPQQPDWFNPEVFPNPSSGGMTLKFTTVESSFTQIAIYDPLGKQIMEVMNGYSNEGPQSISLGTETLPSGKYVCRVRVGDMVSYINLAITK